MFSEQNDEIRLEFEKQGGFEMLEACQEKIPNKEIQKQAAKICEKYFELE